MEQWKNKLLSTRGADDGLWGPAVDYGGGMIYLLPG